jgi:hypothetical protein
MSKAAVCVGIFVVTLVLCTWVDTLTKFTFLYQAQFGAFAVLIESGKPGFARFENNNSLVSN